MIIIIAQQLPGKQGQVYTVKSTLTRVCDLHSSNVDSVFHK